MIRVCNLCLEQVSKEDDDDDDDRRSVVSSVTSSFPPHQLGHPQSPFAASQVFGRKDEPFNLFSIAETRRFAPDDEGGQLFSPRDVGEEDHMWETIRASAAPFRRAQLDDDKEPGPSPPRIDMRDRTPSPGSNIRHDFPTALSLNTEGLSSIQFPSTGTEQLDSPIPPDVMRSRLNSFNSNLDAPTPFIRSRAQSRLGFDSRMMAEPGWRTRRESTAYVVMFISYTHANNYLAMHRS
jgi:1-phosphatidylinositol-3-phosphate 5-kinase